jgi:hypothetical protein
MLSLGIERKGCDVICVATSIIPTIAAIIAIPKPA